MAPPGRRTLILTLAFLVAIAFTFVFGFRAGRHARLIRWENQPIHGWMSVPFIAHTHHVPAEILYRAIKAEPRPKDRRPLRRLAHEQKRPVEELIREINDALAKNGAKNGVNQAPAPESPSREKRRSPINALPSSPSAPLAATLRDHLGWGAVSG